MSTPTELAVELDRVATKLTELQSGAAELARKRSNSQYLQEMVSHLSKSSKSLDKAIDVLLRGKVNKPKPIVEEIIEE